MDQGKLYLISLPIGNLQDITLRALEMLKQINYVVAEDTREIGKLFKFYELPKSTFISYREQNHDRTVPYVLQILKSGHDVALVSDRGTPTISDPGFRLVRDLSIESIEIVSIPGVSAAIAAVSISGLPTDRFSFLGFLPRGDGKQQKILKQFAEIDATFIAYESPFRIITLLENIHAALGNIDVALAHELTKMNEGVIRGKVLDVIEALKDKKQKGEWVVLGRA